MSDFYQKTILALLVIITIFFGIISVSLIKRVNDVDLNFRNGYYDDALDKVIIKGRIRALENKVFILENKVDSLTSIKK